MFPPDRLGYKLFEEIACGIPNEEPKTPVSGKDQIDYENPNKYKHVETNSETFNHIFEFLTPGIKGYVTTKMLYYNDPNHLNYDAHNDGILIDGKLLSTS